MAKHLVMAGRLVDLDPELAFQHALAASRRGGRLAAVREAVGVTAYAAGHYGEALREFRTFRRISGSNVHLPVMADCERGLGRPDRALDLARSEEAESLDAAGKVELAMVVSGARTDLGQLDAAVAALEIPQLDLHRAFSFSPRLFRAYADALDAVGRSNESEKWRRQASVAERALGIEEDEDPDIIDLGEDDEPAPARVPRVAEVLGGEHPAQAEPGDGGSGGMAEGDAPHTGHGVSKESDGEAGGAPQVEPESQQESDPEPDSTTEQASDAGDVSEGIAPADVSADVSADDEADDDDVVASGTGISGGSGTDGEPADRGVATDGADAGEPPSVEAAPAAPAQAPVQALQTETLFSMDDSGAADFAGNTDVAGGVVPIPVVEFSELSAAGPGSEPAGTTGAGGTDASVAPEAGTGAPARKRTAKPTADQADTGE